MWLRNAWVAAACSVLACVEPQNGAVSVEVAQAAVEQAALTAQLATLVADAVDLSSRFDVGQSLEDAAAQLQTALQQQLPCATLARQASELHIQYDAGPTACTYHNRSLAGEQTLRVLRNADNEVAVHHEWQAFRDATLSLSGSADVTWSRTSRSRRVVHAVSFEVLQGPSAGQTGYSSGDSTQSAMDAGVRIYGTREWSGSLGHYALAMEAIEQRFTDGVPQSGAYELTTPTGEALTLAFGRIDTDTIAVTVHGAQRVLSFVVRADGRVEP